MDEHVLEPSPGAQGFSPPSKGFGVFYMPRVIQGVVWVRRLHAVRGQGETDLGPWVWTGAASWVAALPAAEGVFILLCWSL